MGHGYVFPRGQLMPEERLMFLIALVVVGSVGGAFALATIHAEAASSRWRALWEGLPERLRRGGWGWLLVPVAVMYALLARLDSPADHRRTAGRSANPDPRAAAGRQGGCLTPC